MSGVLTWITNVGVLVPGDWGIEAEDATDLQWAFRRDSVVLYTLGAAAYLGAGDNPPNGTNLANGHYRLSDGTEVELTFMGARPSGAYGHDDADYIDPDGDTLRYDLDDQAAQRTRLAFHQAWPDWWCEEVTPSELQGACMASGDEASEACGACTELGLLFHRDGTSVDDYDAGAEPFCDAWTNIEYLYASTEGYEEESFPRQEAVADWCQGCAISIEVFSTESSWVDAETELTAYYNRLGAFASWNSAQASYWLSQAQYSLHDFFAAWATNYTNEVSSIALLLAALKQPEVAVTRIQGGPEGDDFFGELQEAKGYITAPRDGAGSEHLMLVAPTADSQYPWVLMWDWDARTTEDGEVELTARDFGMLPAYFVGYGEDVELTIWLDHAEWVSGDATELAAAEETVRWKPGEVHTIGVSLRSDIVAGDGNFSNDHDDVLEVNLLQFSFFVSGGGSEGLCEP